LCWKIQPPKSFRKRFDPISLSALQSHTFRIGKYNEELNRKTDEEVEERLKVMKKDFEVRFATYIGNKMLQF
jgi:hypothetical protein